jgi:hypothetical protein
MRDNYQITYMSMKPAILSNGIVVYSFRYDLQILTVIWNVLPNFKFLLYVCFFFILANNVWDQNTVWFGGDRVRFNSV